VRKSIWPGIRPDVVKYVKQCDVCYRAKPAQNTQVGFHNSRIVTKPMERIFIDFVGPIVRSRRGNLALLVVLDGFSKFVLMYPVRKITSSAVVDCLVGKYFPSYGIPNCIVSDNAAVFKSRLFYIVFLVGDKACHYISILSSGFSGGAI
jgi:hypothetical protein